MKKTNNKGFSLIELIIVIAIMAILVGVLAPQLIQYVEKSRVSADAQNLDAYVTAVKSWVVDEMTKGETIADGNLATSDDGVLSVDSTTYPGLEDYLDKALGDSNSSLQFKSNAYKDAAISIVTTEGIVTVANVPS